MEYIVLTHKASQAHANWGMWWNLYHFELDGLAGREAWQTWTDSLLEWEAGFHLEHVALLGATVLPQMPGGVGSADSPPSVYHNGGPYKSGLRVSRGTSYYEHGLHVPFGTHALRAGGLLYHGCLETSDLRQMVRGSTGLKTWPEFFRSVCERAEDMSQTHFSHLRANIGGGGSVYAGYRVPVEMFKVPYVSLMHATTRARFRNQSPLQSSYPEVWSLCINAARTLAPIHAEAVNVGVDVVPVSVVSQGVDAGGGLYQLRQKVQQLAGASNQSEEEQDRNEPRFGLTRDAITDIAGKLGEWYEQKFQPILNTLIPYDYYGDKWFTDQQAESVYDGLGAGLGIAAPLMYADWVGMQKHEGGYAGGSPTPDLIELSL